MANKPLSGFSLHHNMTEGGVSINGLSKNYGLTQALHGIQLEIRPGEVFGYIGPNGAGKTTTLKCIVGLIRDYEGEILLNGRPLSDGGSIHSIGYMPQSPRFVSWRTVHRALRLFGRLNGMQDQLLEERIDEVLQMLGMEDYKDIPVTRLSGETLQKLGFAQAVLHCPSILILDEPMSLLDQGARKTLRGIIRGLRDEGATVIFSSHILSDVQDIADRVGIIQDGRILHVGPMEDIKREMRATGMVDLELSVDPKIDINDVCGVSSVASLGPTSYRISIEDGQSSDVVIDEIIWNIMNSGGSVRSLMPVTRTLEDIYMRYLAGGTDR